MQKTMQKKYQDILVHRFITQIVKDFDFRLINFVFGKDQSQTKLDELLSNWDIEVAGGHRALFLSYIMQTRTELKFPDYVGPRLKGLLMRNRFDNLRLIAHFSKIVHAFNDAGIVPLVIKGGAMKHFRSELPRNMGDIDVVVSTNEQYLKAQEIVHSLGYEFEQTTHAFDIHEKNSELGILDVHYRIDVVAGIQTGSSAELFAEATEEQVFGVKAFVPSPERMMFILLQNLYKNLKYKCSIGGVLYSLFDADWLIKTYPSLNWSEVSRLAKEFKAEGQVILAGRFINSLVSGMIPNEIVESLAEGYNLEDESMQCLFIDEYLQPTKLKCKKLRLVKALKSWNEFLSYLKSEFLHKYYRWINRRTARIAKFMEGKERESNNAC